jgi:catechol 2,3-dioxygenase-like lactoylglutathione lyase family enzyme
MLTYITIGTNDLQRAAAFMTLFLTCLAIHVCLPGPRTGQWGDENNPDEGFSFCICPPFDRQPATAGNGTMFAFRAANAELVRRFHAAGLLAGGRMKACQGHEPHTAPIFMLPICAILTGISWHAFSALFSEADTFPDEE